MRVGIIGSGKIGMAIAGHAVAADHDVMLSHRGDAASMADRLAPLGPKAQAGTVPETAAFGDVVFLAVVWDAVPDVGAQVSSWAGKVVVDPTNPLRVVDGRPSLVEYDAGTSSEVVARAVPGARLVKGFGNYFAHVLAENPVQERWRRVMLLAGDDNDAKLLVADLANGMGFAPVDLGCLVDGGRGFQVGGPLGKFTLRAF